MMSVLQCSAKWAAIHPLSATTNLVLWHKRPLALWTIRMFPAVKWWSPPLAVGWNAAVIMLCGISLKVSCWNSLAIYQVWPIFSVARHFTWYHLEHSQQNLCSSLSGAQMVLHFTAAQVGFSPYLNMSALLWQQKLNKHHALSVRFDFWKKNLVLSIRVHCWRGMNNWQTSCNIPPLVVDLGHHVSKLLSGLCLDKN